MSEERIYGYDGILRKLEADRQYHADYLFLLEKVVVKTKKDGTAFKNINQNFENGRVEIKSFNDSFHPSFVVSGYSESGKYVSYDFDAFIYEDYLPKDDERRKKVVNRGGIFRNTYVFEVQDIIERLEEEKERQREYIANYDKQIAASKAIYDKVSEKLTELQEMIKTETFSLRDGEKKVFPSSLEYILKDFVKTNI